LGGCFGIFESVGLAGFFGVRSVEIFSKVINAIYNFFKPKIMANDSQKVCCPEFDSAPFEGKEFVWQDKLFIKETIRQFLHMPLPWVFGKAVVRMFQKIEVAGAKAEVKDFLMLCHDPSPWKSELYMSVTREVPSAENIKLSGKFLTRVFDGPYNAVPKWIKEMDKYVAEKGQSVKKYYFYFTSCPKCAKLHGHNYVVVFAQIN